MISPHARPRPAKKRLSLRPIRLLPHSIIPSRYGKTWITPNGYAYYEISLSHRPDQAQLQEQVQGEIVEQWARVHG